MIVSLPHELLFLARSIWYCTSVLKFKIAARFYVCKRLSDYKQGWVHQCKSKTDGQLLEDRDSLQVTTCKHCGSFYAHNNLHEVVTFVIYTQDSGAHSLSPNNETYLSWQPFSYLDREWLMCLLYVHKKEYPPFIQWKCGSHCKERVGSDVH